MAVRAVNSSTIFRSASPPPLVMFRSCFRQLRTLRSQSYSRLGVTFSNFALRRESCLYGRGSSIRTYSLQSLVDTVAEELAAMRKRGRFRISNKLASSEELVQEKVGKQTLQQGFLLEFKKDTGRVLLAVAQKPDGKKNWIVFDQNGGTSSIKPQQVTFIVPGVEEFDPTEISDFIERAHNTLDPTLLEFAWTELLEKEKSVTVDQLAEMIFGSAEPLESYCAHLLLSKDNIYFTVLESKGPFSVYGPRPASQVEELIQKNAAKELAEREFNEFIKLLKSVKAMPLDAKPSKSSWKTEEKIWQRIEALEAFCIDNIKNEEQRKTAGMILKEMGLGKTSTAALNLLVDIGYFPVHVNLDLLKYNIRTEHPEEILSAAERLLSESPDIDENDRTDLTHLKVYAIDVDEADELDDALSATRTQDGRIKVWIHVADPTRLVQPGSIIDKEAMKRGTSTFLPTATYPMFPEKLAMEAMSLKQGTHCRAVTVSVVLQSDGRTLVKFNNISWSSSW